MLILGPLDMYFNAAVVFFIISSLFFRMAFAILAHAYKNIPINVILSQLVWTFVIENLALEMIITL